MQAPAESQELVRQHGRALGSRGPEKGPGAPRCFRKPLVLLRRASAHPREGCWPRATVYGFLISLGDSPKVLSSIAQRANICTPTLPVPPDEPGRCARSGAGGVSVEGAQPSSLATGLSGTPSQRVTVSAAACPWPGLQLLRKPLGELDGICVVWGRLAVFTSARFHLCLPVLLPSE